MYSCLLLLCSPSVSLGTKVKSISLLSRKWRAATAHQCPELFAKSHVLLMVVVRLPWASIFLFSTFSLKLFLAVSQRCSTALISF